MNENAWILINISLKFVPKGPINNIPALVQIMKINEILEKKIHHFNQNKIFRFAYGNVKFW